MDDTGRAVAPFVYISTQYECLQTSLCVYRQCVICIAINICIWWFVYTKKSFVSVTGKTP